MRRGESIIGGFAQDGAAEETPARPYAWYVLGVLTFAYIVSFIDRQIFSLLIEPIRQDLGITDTQISLLGGFAFALLYTTAGMPIAWLADHRSRRVIIAVGASVWTVMTAACGLSKTFGQLFLARVGVGVGEAALTPAAFSLIADYFPARQLGRAMGIYMAAVALGSGLALVVGGTILAYTANLSQIVLPFFGVLQPWQLTFVCAALPGSLVVVLMLTVREPVRRGRKIIPGAVSKGDGAVSPRAAAQYVLANSRLYMPILVGFLLVALVKNAVIVWAPTMYMRTYGWSASSIGYAYGVLLLILGPLGALGGGMLADRLRRGGIIEGPLRLTVITGILTVPVTALMPLMPAAGSSLALLAMFTFAFSAMTALAPLALQLITPNQLRAQVAAFSAFLNNLLGLGLGPILVALTTDYWFGDDGALRYSISSVGAVFAALAALSFWIGIKPFRAQCREFDAPEHAPAARPQTS